VTSLRKASDLEIRPVGEEVLVHHPSRQKVHVLNHTAGQILELCDGERTQEDIVDSICRETGADPRLVARDVTDLLAEFEQLGLIKSNQVDQIG
jgi:PqqD family protein of HPr-rel-A system